MHTSLRPKPDCAYAQRAASRSGDGARDRAIVQVLPVSTGRAAQRRHGQVHPRRDDENVTLTYREAEQPPARLPANLDADSTDPWTDDLATYRVVRENDQKCERRFIPALQANAANKCGRVVQAGGSAVVYPVHALLSHRDTDAS